MYGEGDRKLTRFVQIHDVNKKCVIVGIIVNRENRSLREWGEEITKTYEELKQ